MKASRCFYFFFQAEDGIRDLVRSRGLGDVYKRQILSRMHRPRARWLPRFFSILPRESASGTWRRTVSCLLYTSDAADDLLCVDLGGRRLIKQKNGISHTRKHVNNLKNIHNLALRDKQRPHNMSRSLLRML